MIYGIESSTDSRSRHCIIKKFSSLKSAKKWANSEENGKYDGSKCRIFIYIKRLSEDAGAANNKLPMYSQNYHKLLRDYYEMPLGWRPPSKKQIEKMKGERPWECRYTNNQLLFQVIYSNRIKEPKQEL